MNKFWKLLLGALCLSVLAGCKISGQASGVIGTLQIKETHSGETLKVTADGPFAFTTDFPLDSTYNVVAELDQPPPDYVCEVINGSGKVQGDVTNVEVNCGNRIACTLQYEPVCAKTLSNIVCITTPCPSYQYQTFGNACEAGRENAEISFAGECGSLENILAFEYRPVRLVDLTVILPAPESIPDLLAASIRDDRAELTVAFSGCDDNHDIDLLVNTRFAESNPVQVASLLQHGPVEDCDAYFTKSVSIDLLPLKHRYMDAYQQTSGTIVIKGIGTYRF